MLAQQRFRLGVALLGDQGIDEDGLRVRVVRLPGQRLARERLGLGRLALGAGEPRLRHRAPERGGVEQAAPFAGLCRVQLQGAGEQGARLVVPALAQAHQPQAADHLGVVGARAHGLLEGGLRFCQVAAFELAQAPLPRLVVGVGQQPPLRLAALVELGQRLARRVVVRHFLQVALEPDREGGVIVDAIQRAAPDIERGRAVGIGALGEPVQHVQPFRAGRGAVGQQVGQHQREARVVRLLAQQFAHLGDGGRAARVGAGEDAVIVDGQFAARRSLRKQPLQPLQRFLLVAGPGQHAHGRHLALVAGGDPVGVLEFARGGVARMLLAQALQDLLRLGRAVGAQLDLAEHQQRLGMLGIDGEDLVQRAARHVGAVLGIPHARRRQQAREFRRVRIDGRRWRRRARLGGGRHGVDEQQRGGAVQRGAGHEAVQAGVSAPSVSKRYRPSR